MDKVLRFLLLAVLMGIIPCIACFIGCGEDDKGITGPEPIHYDDYIVYVGAYGITMINRDLSDEKIIAPGEPADLLSPIWSPQKTEIVYVRINGSGEKQIELYRNDGSIDTLAMGMIDKSPWSPDGTKIAFACNDSVFVVDTKGSRPVSLMAAVGKASFLDNSHIVCFKNTGGREEEGSIYIVSISGGAPIKLFPPSETAYAFIMCPRAMPGGNSVAFARLDDDNWSERWNDLWTVNADGSDAKAIARIYTIWGLLILVKELDISSDGDFFLVVHDELFQNRHPYEIYVPSETYSIIDAVDCSTDIRSIDYAPDSRDFVFEKETGGIAIFDRSEGQTINLDSSGKHPNW
jgi:Tol biopolymer transport system component